MFIGFRSIAIMVLGLVATVNGDAPAVRSKLPTYGITYAPPDGAIFNTTTKGSKSIGIFEFAKGSDFAGAILQMELVQTRGGTIDQVAAEFAGKQNGQVLNGALSVGGEKAVKIAERAGADGRTVTNYIVLHHRALYVFRIESRRGIDASKFVAPFLGSVTFMPFESPWEHLADAGELSFNVLDTFTVGTPDFMRPSSDEPGQLYIGAVDRTEANQNFVANFQAVHTQEPKTFAELQQDYSKGIEGQLHSTEPLKWTLQPGTGRLHVSQAIVSDLTRDDGTKAHAANRFCMLDLGGGNFVQILFTVDPVTTDRVKPFSDLCDRILASVKLVAKQPAGK